MNLSDLATTILRIEQLPISKVRFAKTIYFVHKELIRLKLSTNLEIEYIRMPLGPVPFGFMELAANNPLIVVTKLFTGLAYNTSQYSLRKRRLSVGNKSNLDLAVKNALDKLRIMTTSELVELSHKDPSWINNANGRLFSISNKDLDNSLPFRFKSSNASSEEDDQLLQASLVQGMIHDIVNESTDLEHPADDGSTTRNT